MSSPFGFWIKSSLRLLILPTLFAAASWGNEAVIIIESDVQSADNKSGILTATGNVRLDHQNIGITATSNKVQYFTHEQRLVLTGDVEVLELNGNLLQADQVVYILNEKRAVATPKTGEQVISKWNLIKQAELNLR